MNKFFVFGLLSFLLVTSFASANLGQWLKERFSAESDPQLAPIPSGSPYSCTANTDTKTRTLQACQWVKSPLGQFTIVQAETVGTNRLVSNSFSNTGQIDTESLLIKTSDALPNTGFLMSSEYIPEIGAKALTLKYRDPQDPDFRSSNLGVEGSILSNGVQTDELRVSHIKLNTVSGSPLASFDYDSTNGLVIDPLASPAQVAIEGDFRVTGTGKFDTLAGTGNAYVCVNSVGQIFRSLTPCR